ncbi:MAG TPA: LamG domain-containing protein, partial [Chitinophagales bacterium]|nr:LamG domain-containing protein [Chitinophagales bacterium]
PTIIPGSSTIFCSGGSVQLTASDVNLAGSALNFTGGQYLNFGNPPALKITGNQTIEMWLKPSNLAAGRQNPYDKAYGGEGTITQEPDGTLNYYYGTNGGNAMNYQGFGSGATLTQGQWNHIALVRDFTNNQLRWYINGTLTSTATPSYFPAVAGGNPVRIGLGYTGVGYEGQIDEVRVWNIARTTADIQTNMNKPIQAGTAGLAGYWRFDETAGTIVVDASGNSNTGTFGSPAPTWVNPSGAPMVPSYTWSPATGLNTTTGPVVTASPTSNQTYTVTAASP